MGSIIGLNGEIVEVVGVMPEAYKFPWDVKIWLPISRTMLAPLENNPRAIVNVYAALKSDHTVNEANIELGNLMRQIRQRYPNDDSYVDYEAANTAHISTFPESVFGGLVKSILYVVVSIVTGAIFLLACINVGTLLLARTNEHLKDISIRVALGAPRGRLLFQVMGESIVISIVGGVLAVLLASIGLELINLLFVLILDQDTIAFWMIFYVDGSTLVGAAGFVVITVLLTSALPAWRIINGDFNSVIRDGTRGALGLMPSFFSRALVVISISVISLLIYVGVIFGGELIEFKNSYSTAQYSEQNTNQVRAFFKLDSERFSASQRLQTYRSLRTALVREIQGLEDDDVSISLNAKGANIEMENDSKTASDDYPVASIRLVLGAQVRHESAKVNDRVLLEGRYISDTDNNSGEQNIVVLSASLAEALWPNQSAVGQRIRLVNQRGSNDQAGLLNGELSPWRQVVGVVSDNSVRPSIFGFAANEVFMPLHGNETQRAILLLSPKGGAVQKIENLLTLSKKAITAVDPTITFSFEGVGESLDSLKLLLNSVINFIIACVSFSFLIAIAGIYGLVQGSVQLATQEIGTRRALGASDTKIMSTFLKRGGKQVLGGFAIAAVLAFPPTYILFITVGAEFVGPMLVRVAVVVLGLYACIGCALYFPIRKVLQLEPSEALRYE